MDSVPVGTGMRVKPLRVRTPCPPLMTLVDRHEQAEYLVSLAKEIGCDTDSDLVVVPSEGAQVVFIGRHKKCWVRFVNPAQIELLPNQYPHQTIDMTDPECMERLEKWFHENS